MHRALVVAAVAVAVLMVCNVRAWVRLGPPAYPPTAFDR